MRRISVKKSLIFDVLTALKKRQTNRPLVSNGPAINMKKNQTLGLQDYEHAQILSLRLCLEVV